MLLFAALIIDHYFLFSVADDRVLSAQIAASAKRATRPPQRGMAAANTIASESAPKESRRFADIDAGG